MKILRLDLRAFGPFTGVSLDLSRGREGLHLIFGPNEAGKSSALRALKQLLYGIPGQTADRFVHEYDKLRIGGTLRHVDGSELTFLRRKGNRRVLRAADDRAEIDESLLETFLAGVGKERFETMFGIDHDELVAGGRAIVEGKGEVGQLVFGAGTDLGRLRRFQKRLDEEWSALFKPRGENPPLNQALAEFQQAERDIGAASIKSEDWHAHRSALDEAIREKETIARSLADLQRRKARLERIQQALPDLGRRRELIADWDALAGEPILREDFAEERRQVEEELRSARKAGSTAEAELAEIASELESIDVPEPLLDESATIEALRLRLGGHLKEQVEVDRLRVELQTYRASIGAMLRELGHDATPDNLLERAESLRLTAAQRRRIQTLSQNRLALSIECDESTKAIDNLTRKSEAARAALEELEDLRDPEPLRQALRRAIRNGDLEEQVETARRELARMERQATSALRKLAPWSGGLVELEGQSVPSAETIDHFDAELADAAGVLTQIEAKLAEVAQERIEIDQRIEQLQLEQDVPDEEDLRAARAHRDEGWRLSKKQWLSGDADPESVRAFAGDLDLASAFERSIEQADSIVDRLRREASRVAEKARLNASRHALQARLEDLEHQREAATARQRELADRWHAVWTPLGFCPLSPREMRAWHREHTKLSEKLDEIRDRREAVAELEARIQQLHGELGRLLAGLGEPEDQEGESLAARIERGQQVVQEIQTLASSRDRTRKDVERFEAELSAAKANSVEARQKLEEWRVEWAESMALLRLRAEATTEEAMTVLERNATLFEMIDKAHQNARRIQIFEEEHQCLAADVRTLTDRMAPDLAEVSEIQAIERLNERLNAARAAKARRDDLEKRRARQQEEARTARAEIADASERLASLCREASCDDPAALDERQRRSDRRRAVEQELQAVHNRLRALAAGATIEEFVSDAAAIDSDAIAIEIHGLQDQIDREMERRGELDQSIGRERKELESMDEAARDARASEASVKSQHLLARIESQAIKYMQLRLASAVLRQAIERYRERNQGPVLGRAASLFATLTRGSFQGLRTEHDDKDQTVLAGVRQDDTLVFVDGMSEGTRDQLYLALKLASLEHHLDHNTPLPFVVDDILVNFDDDRALAALEVLAQLSRRTQVLFFTHHEHLIALAKEHLDPEMVFTHELRCDSLLTA